MAQRSHSVAAAAEYTMVLKHGPSTQLVETEL